MEKKHAVSIATHAWFGDTSLDLDFPEGWNIHECRMEGHGAKAIDLEEIRKNIENPIGTVPLSSLAKGKTRVVILFDDFTRPTPVAAVLPAVLDSLFAAGIKPDQIRFISALGTHRAMTRRELAGKLGEDVVVDYPVYNHNAWEHLVDMGHSSKGTPIRVNREYASCDLKIGIGCIVPHSDAGFSGGMKIVLPGVMGMETITYNHTEVFERDEDGAMVEFNFGKVYGNAMRDDMHEIVQKVGLDFKVDVLMNEKREATRVYCGDGLESFYEGVKFAKTFYATQPFLGADITIANTYPLENEASKSVWTCYLSTREGGDAVMLCHSPDGQIHHFGTTRFGTNYGGAQMPTPRLPQPLYERTLILNPYHLRVDTDYFGQIESAFVFRTWQELLEQLRKKHGERAEVALYPCPSIQCPPFAEDY